VLKSSLHEAQKMSGTAVVYQAKGWADSLVRAESRGPGDTENAMRRIEQMWGVPYGVLWALRYRPPKDISASVLLAIFNAHEAMCERQRKKYEHELAISRAKGGSSSVLARMAAALAGQSEEVK
jgi:hypothetical protein